MTSPKQIEIKQLSWQQAKPEAELIRRTVFIEEQNVSENEEWDGEDESCIHILAYLNNQAVGTARLTPAGKVGRMSVLKPHRNQGVGSLMLKILVQAAIQNELKAVTVWAQTDAQAFYEKYGFIAYGQMFLDAGIPHMAMYLPFEA